MRRKIKVYKVETEREREREKRINTHKEKKRLPNKSRREFFVANALINVQI